MSVVLTMIRRRWRPVSALVVFSVLAGALQGRAFIDVAGETAAERAAFARQSEALTQQLTFLAPPPTDLSTLGGYVTWRVFGTLAVMLGVWAVWFAASVLRGDERAGWGEQFLAAGLTRAELVWCSVAAFTLSSVTVVAALCAGIALADDGTIDPSPLALQGVALVAVVSVLYGLGVVLAQVARDTRQAVAAGATAVGVLNAMHSMSETVPLMHTVRFMSPYTWYGRSEPLVTAGSFSASATAGLLVAALLLITVGTLLFSRRDLGAPLPARPQALTRVVTARAWWWYRIPVLSLLFGHRRALTAWAVGMLALVAFFAAVAPSLVAALQQIESLTAYLATIADGDVRRGVIGLFLVGTFQLLVALLAISFVSHWSAEDDDGRLQMLLSTPLSRTAVVLWRAASVAVGTLVATTAAMALLLAVSAGTDLGITVAAAARTVGLLVLFALAFAAVGTVLTAVVPRVAVLGLTAFTVVSYFLNEVAPIYQWPPEVRNLSVFHLVGNPLIAPPPAGGLIALAGVTGLGFAAATWLMRGRDLGG